MNVADMHCDTITEIYSAGRKNKEASILKNDFSIDLMKMKQGNYIIQNFALYTDMGVEQNPLEYTLKLLDLFYQELEQHAELIGIVKSYQDIEENRKNGRMSAMLTIEEGACCRGELVLLRNFYRLGVRMMTFTWNYPNELGYPNIRTFGEDGSTRWQADEVHGITEKGIAFLEEMERIGMIMDVSHLSDAGIMDVLHYTKKPFVASHSNARTMAGHPRNLTDDMIKKMADKGCVAGINYCAAFLKNWGQEESMKSTVKDMAAHIKHYIKVGGIGCVGLGSDFDGITSVLEMKSAAHLSMLEQELYNCGLKEWEVEAVFYKNVLRIYQELL